MAQNQGVSPPSTISGAHKLQPHRTKTFKLSRDPKFLEMMTDVVGLNPPQRAMLLCVDERARFRHWTGHSRDCPSNKGVAAQRTNDHKRSGTTTLFAAMDTWQGKVVGEAIRHRHQVFLKFLRRIDSEFPGNVPLHLIMDNYGTPKHEKVRQ
jgi:hypothetical protein